MASGVMDLAMPSVSAKKRRRRSVVKMETRAWKGATPSSSWRALRDVVENIDNGSEIRGKTKNPRKTSPFMLQQKIPNMRSTIGRMIASGRRERLSAERRRLERGIIAEDGDRRGREGERGRRRRVVRDGMERVRKA
jgi:hypothetical protein